MRITSIYFEKSCLQATLLLALLKDLYIFAYNCRMVQNSRSGCSVSYIKLCDAIVTQICYLNEIDRELRKRSVIFKVLKHNRLSMLAEKCGLYVSYVVSTRPYARETNQGNQNRINWLNVYVNLLSSTFLEGESELIYQMEIGIGRKISIFSVSLGVRLC